MTTPHNPSINPQGCPNLALEDLVAHLDGELTASDSTRVEAHLSACAACHAEAALLSRAGDAVAGLPAIEPGTQFADRVLRAARAPASSPRGRLIRPWTVAAAVAAALFLAFYFSPYGKQSDSTEPEIAYVLTEEEIQAIAEDLPLLANLDALEELNGSGDPSELIALIEDLDLLESVETESLDALDELLSDEEGG